MFDEGWGLGHMALARMDVVWPNLGTSLGVQCVYWMLWHWARYMSTYGTFLYLKCWCNVRIHGAPRRYPIEADVVSLASRIKRQLGLPYPKDWITSWDSQQDSTGHMGQPMRCLMKAGVWVRWPQLEWAYYWMLRRWARHMSTRGNLLWGYFPKQCLH